jgi:hypothetical protein
MKPERENNDAVHVSEQQCTASDMHPVPETFEALQGRGDVLNAPNFQARG